MASEPENENQMSHVSETDPNSDHFDERNFLNTLTENVRDQDDLERDIGVQANRALNEAEDQNDQKRIEKAELKRARLEKQKQQQEEKLQAPIGPTMRQRIRTDLAKITDDIEECKKDIADFKARIAQRQQDSAKNESATNASGRLPNETQREYLIRTGKITPFSVFGGPRPEGVEGDLADAILDAEDEAIAENLANQDGPRSHQNLRLPGFSEDVDVSSSAVESEISLRPRKKRKVKAEPDSSDEFTPSAAASDVATPVQIADEDSDDVDLTNVTPTKKRRKVAKQPNGKEDLSGIDDGNEDVHQSRLEDWVTRRSRARRHHRAKMGQADEDSGDEAEWFKPSPDEPDHQFENGLKLPGDIYPSLFDYQKTGVQWLAELFSQNVGGIIGDEMGLGKTVQLISFVTAMHYSKKLDKPVIVVAPATVLRQWVNEFHRWWPPLRVSILHSSGSGMFNAHEESEIEDEDGQYEWGKKVKKSSKSARDIVNRVVKHGHVLVTTYAGLQTYSDILTPINWGYAVLDEGHKIRNPNTSITIHCKELRTANRVILSGTPLQNNLTELWSLFDFIYPMRLGTLVAFRNEFEIPIKLGGYANATNLQIMTAQKCAETLKDAISPYLLQRMKVDVAADLPKKTEQVLFCKLTSGQQQAYKLFLKSDDMNAILNRTRQSLYGIDILRKICNHPDLLDPKLRHKYGYNWGDPAKSGKLQVVKSLLPIWKRLGHKTLVFSQGTQMLDIIEEFVKSLDGVDYVRMDGKTAIKERQTLVDRFNNTPELNVFLLTTKVGGLGVNLTGASRVIIYDPDWNPSTDMQARERAWRLGQKKEVVIYRLMTAGTIEEKIYHRQIFKSFLTNKVLKDPKQRTNFNLHDLHDLFSLNSYEDGKTETSELFKGSKVEDYKASMPTELHRPGSESIAPTFPKAKIEAKIEASETSKVPDGDEAHRIEGVASVEEYNDGPETQPTEEDRIMEGIFARSGVHSTLEHDEIMNGKKTVRADPKILQHEANKAAVRAASALRQAEQQARAVPIGTVTWTGEVGEAGRPMSARRGRGGPASAGILNRIATRQGLCTAPVSRSASSSPAPRNLKMKDFEKMIPEFIKRHGGQVPSKLLVDHFNTFCTTTRSADEFKKALNEVAEMEKVGSRMRAIWKAKPQYR